MIQYLDYLTAMLIGLLSSGHCLSMCGGIVAALSLKKNIKTNHFYHIAYNVGRIISYSTIALFVNILGYFFFELGGYYTFLFKILSNLVLIIIGLHITNISNSIFLIDSLLLYVWKFILKIISKIKPSRNILYALILGFLWGYIPCGLIYSTIIWSVGFESIVKSSVLMIFFGIGTLPSMLLVGILSVKFNKIFCNALVKYVAGSFIILFGFKNIIMLFVSKSCH